MRLKALAFLFCLFLAGSAFASEKNYQVAHTRWKEHDFVFVKVAPSYFDASPDQQQRWFTDVRACAREARLKGSVMLVAHARGKFRFYGSKELHDIVRNLDMGWVNAHLNKTLDCEF